MASKERDVLAVDLEVNNLPKATADVKKFTTVLTDADKQIEKLGTGSSFDAQLAKSTQRHKEFLAARAKNTKAAAAEAATDFKDNLASSVGLGASAGALAGTAIGAGVVLGLSKAIDSAKEAADAQIVLASQAKETGVAYDVLARKAESFGQKAALSNSDAQKTFAQLVNFANAAGRGDKIDEFTRKFTDLAAAKGINASQLGDISRQLNALTDEATDKLLNANPSAFYAKFAESLGKTADALTDTEKRAAVFDAVLRKGAIFDGSAAQRAGTLSGELDTLRKSFDDIAASAGKAIGPVVQFLAASTNTAVSGNASEQTAPFFQGLLNTLSGLNPLNGFTQQTTSSDAFAAFNIAAEQQAKLAQKAVKDGFDKAKADVAAAAKDPNQNFANFAISKFLNAGSFLAASPIEQEKMRAAATTNAEAFIKTQKEIFGGAVKRADIGEITAQAEVFRSLKNVFDPADAQKITESFSSGLTTGFDRILADAKNKVPELRATLKQITSDPNLSGADRDSLARSFTEAITEAVKAGREKVKELGKTQKDLFSGLFGAAGETNPFVKVFSEAEKQINAVTLATATLDEKLQKTALSFVQNTNNLNLFNARLDAALGASDLRAGADRFRNGPGDSTRVRPEDFARVVNDAIARSLPGSRQGQGDLSQAERLQLFEKAQSDSLRFSGQNESTIVSFLARQRVANAPGSGIDEGQSVRDNLQRQLKVIEGLRPGNDAERQAADRRIIALTESLDPSALSETQRIAAATARENEALRLDKQETAARAAQVEQKVVFDSIDTNIGKLLKIAESDGLTGVIRIINEAEDKAKTRLSKRPGDADTANAQNN